MNFRSDNMASAAPEMLAALAQANAGVAPSYGVDQYSSALDRAFSEVFEHEAHVFPVSSGTAANAIALASVTPPWGAVICHREAHIEVDEAGATQFFSGTKHVLVDGLFAKVTPAALGAVLRGGRSVHASVPSVLSISQASERGALYNGAELGELSAIAHEAKLAVHMDGARFANAAAALKCAPAEISWRAGVDILSFGATKNGALGAEAIIVFDGRLCEEIERRRKRSGHLLSKMRYVSAQLLAYLEGDRWLAWAGRANASAKQLGEAAGPLLIAPVETNQVFIKLDARAMAVFRASGADFYEWGEIGSGEVRLVTAWNQHEREVEQMTALLRGLR